MHINIACHAKNVSNLIFITQFVFFFEHFLLLVMPKLLHLLLFLGLFKMQLFPFLHI